MDRDEREQYVVAMLKDKVDLLKSMNEPDQPSNLFYAMAEVLYPYTNLRTDTGIFHPVNTLRNFGTMNRIDRYRQGAVWALDELLLNGKTPVWIDTFTDRWDSDQFDKGADNIVRLLTEHKIIVDDRPIW